MRHSHPRCRRCGERWPQHTGALCRRCARALGLMVTTFARDAARLIVQSKRTPAVRPDPPAPREPRTVIIHGTEYEVVFDGTVR